MDNIFHTLSMIGRRYMVLHEAINEIQPEIIADFLREHPAEDEYFYDTAKEHINDAPWHSLLISLGLIIAESVKSSPIIAELVNHEFPGWNILKQKYVDILFCFAQEKNEKEIFCSLINRFKRNNVKLIIPDIKSPLFYDWLTIYIEQKLPIENIMKKVIAYLELESTLSLKKEAIFKDLGIENAYSFSKLLWNNNQKEDSLSLLHIFSIGYPGIIEDEMLIQISENLLNLTPHPISDFVMVDLKDSHSTIPHAPLKKMGYTKLSFGLVRSANILRLNPSYKWVKNLKESWIGLKDIIEDEYHEERKKNKLPVVHASAINALSIALGVCSSLDPGYKSLDTGKEHIDSLENKLQSNINERNKLVTDYKNLTEEYDSGKGDRYELETLIIAKRNEIRFFDMQIDKMQNQINHELSPGALLLQALRNIKNSFILRQGAAWGLHNIYKSPYLENSSKERINENMLKAMYSENSLENDFKERLIYFIPTNNLLEFELSIKDGISWILDLLKITDDLEQVSAKIYNHIRWIGTLLIKYIPGIFDFLHKYPLRLMLLEEHRLLLGEYVKEQCDIHLWTNYSPPIWERGMQPGEAGEVHKRYLLLNDRSKPNAMGLYYRLFEHPILVLPVIYHEFLHYGGTNGKPAEGIGNETEVLIREILFMKFLIAELAPNDVQKIPAYEHSINEHIENIGLESLGKQIIMNINKNFNFELMSDNIEKIYGEQLDISEAREKTNISIIRLNNFIQRTNATDEEKENWYPEIEWPELTANESKQLLEEYSNIMFHQFTLSNRIDFNQWDKIYQDETCQNFLSAWNSYITKKNSLFVFTKAWADESLSTEEVTALVSDRYSIAQNLHDFRNLSQKQQEFILNIIQSLKQNSDEEEDDSESND